MSDGVEIRGDVPEGEHTAGPAPATPPQTVEIESLGWRRVASSVVRSLTEVGGGYPGKGTDMLCGGGKGMPGAFYSIESII